MCTCATKLIDCCTRCVLVDYSNMEYNYDTFNIYYKKVLDLGLFYRVVFSTGEIV